MHRLSPVPVLPPGVHYHVYYRCLSLKYPMIFQKPFKTETVASGDAKGNLIRRYQVPKLPLLEGAW